MALTLTQKADLSIMLIIDFLTNKTHTLRSGKRLETRAEGVG